MCTQAWSAENLHYLDIGLNDSLSNTSAVTGVLREGLIVNTANNLSFGRLGEKEGNSFPWSLAPYLSLTVRA